MKRRGSTRFPGMGGAETSWNESRRWSITRILNWIAEASDQAGAAWEAGLAKGKASEAVLRATVRSNLDNLARRGKVAKAIQQK